MTSAETLFAADKLMQLLGARLVAERDGCVEIALTVTEDLVQAHGTCQGGAIFSLADAAFGISASLKRASVSQHCSIAYLRPAKLGETIVARAALSSAVGKTSVYDVHVTNDGGDMIADFRGIARELRS